MAIAKLAKLVQPVTAESLRACACEDWPTQQIARKHLRSRYAANTAASAHETIRSYRKVAIYLASFIIPLSMVSSILVSLKRYTLI